MQETILDHCVAPPPKASTHHITENYWLFNAIRVLQTTKKEKKHTLADAWKTISLQVEVSYLPVFCFLITSPKKVIKM